MSYLTKKTEVTADISIWAVPKYNAEADDDPFNYELFAGGKPWRSGAVKVNTIPVTLMVPEGLNLIQKAIETLKEAQDEVRTEADEKVAELEKRIGEFTLLEYTPTPDAVIPDAPDPEMQDGNWMP